MGLTSSAVGGTNPLSQVVFCPFPEPREGCTWKKQVQLRCSERAGRSQPAHAGLHRCRPVRSECRFPAALCAQRHGRVEAESFFRSLPSLPLPPVQVP